MLQYLNKHGLRWAKGLVACAAMTVLAMPARAEILSVAGVRDSSLPQALYDSGTIFSPGYYDQFQRQDGTAVASAATVNGTAKAQSDYGVNRVDVASFAPVDDENLRRTSIGGPFADAYSIWVDRFVVQGGTGVGTLSVSAIVSGRFGNQPGGFGFYDLVQVDTGNANTDALAVAEFLRDETTANTALVNYVLALSQEVPAAGHGSDAEVVAPGGAFGGVLSGEITFTYGRPFYLISLLGASANDFGSLSAFNSAHFGITAPAGATLTSAAGVSYAAAVPEPATLALTLAGGWVLASWARRQRRR